MNKRILYIGGFELPDKNAAAQRVVANSKIFKSLGYDVLLRGVTRSENYYGSVSEFQYNSIKYPNSMREWWMHLVGINCKDIILQWQPSVVVAYNYPGVALERLRRYCKSKGIKVVGDVTEWYSSRGDLIKWIDTSFRMRYVHKKLDGLIVISRFLNDYYKKSNTILIPPLVDLAEKKWHQKPVSTNPEKISLVYIGTPLAKYNLDLILNSIVSLKFESKISLTVVRLHEKDYCSLFKKKRCGYDFIKFKGMLSHLETIKLLKSSDYQIIIRDDNRVNNAGFSTKLVETISCGIPIITNQTSNINDYIEDGKNGFFIETSSQDSLIKTMSRALSAPRDRIEYMKQYCNENQLFDFRNYIDVLRPFL